MPARSEYLDFLLEQLTPLGGVSARAMFGGFGLYRDGVMFGLVSDDTLYLKVDDRTAPEFDARRLPPFTYARKGGAQPTVMSYRRAPDEAVDDPETLCRWAQEACGAARRSGSGKRRKPGNKGRRG